MAIVRPTDNTWNVQADQLSGLGSGFRSLDIKAGPASAGKLSISRLFSPAIRRRYPGSGVRSFLRLPVAEEPEGWSLYDLGPDKVRILSKSGVAHCDPLFVLGANASSWQTPTMVRSRPSRPSEVRNDTCRERLPDRQSSRIPR